MEGAREHPGWTSVISLCKNMGLCSHHNMLLLQLKSDNGRFVTIIVNIVHHMLILDVLRIVHMLVCRCPFFY